MKRRPASNPSQTTLAFDLVEPRASALVESLRAFGYNLRTAITDLIDNSISANAANIWLRTFWSGSDSYLALIDDGQGMSQAELVNALRPGSKSPVEERAPDDLGRFGLGLKTASFSQCRRLTVWSKREGDRPSLRCWDLDYVSKTQQWRLLISVDDSTQQRLDSLGKPAHGTIVLWENLDRLVGEAVADDTEAQGHFHDAIDEVQAHLSMVFHRFISGKLSISLFVNGEDDDHRLKAWDPFLSNHPATQALSAETLRPANQIVKVEPFVLPHHDKMGKREHKEAGGPAGWNAQQGFYVYRNHRLLVAGSWLGLAAHKEISNGKGSSTGNGIGGFASRSKPPIPNQSPN